jgi:hypothetical protein
MPAFARLLKLKSIGSIAMDQVISEASEIIRNRQMAALARRESAKKSYADCLLSHGSITPQQLVDAMDELGVTTHDLRQDVQNVAAIRRVEHQLEAMRARGREAAGAVRAAEAQLHEAQGTQRAPGIERARAALAEAEERRLDLEAEGRLLYTEHNRLRQATQRVVRGGMWIGASAAPVVEETGLSARPAAAQESSPNAMQ